MAVPKVSNAIDKPAEKTYAKMPKSIDFSAFLRYNKYMMKTTKKIQKNQMLSELDALRAEVKQLKLIVKIYEEQLKLLQQKKFGISSEKSAYDQAGKVEQLALGAGDETDEAIAPSAEEPDLEIVKEHYRKKQIRKDRLPEGLPVEEIFHDLPEEEKACPECGAPMQAIGHECRDEVVFVPATVTIRRHITNTYACHKCEEASGYTPFVKAKAPEPAIKGSWASPESIAHVMCQKFVMGVPLYRQEQGWARQNVLISRQTMANWLIRCSRDWLRPLYDELKRRMLLRDVLHADETTFRVLIEEGKTPGSKSYLWIYRTSGDTDEPIIIAEYQPDRKHKNPAQFLKEFKGYLHSDGYEAYHKLTPDIIVVGCWAHLRRKWDEALKVIKKENRANTKELRGKQYCDKLFAIERGLAQLSAEERQLLRMERLKPLMEEFFSWASNLQALPQSKLGRAIHYMFTQKKYLWNILLDGRLEFSNNRAERTVKPFVICRKNFLFANSESGAEAAAVIFSLIETAKETGLDPFKYLTYVFKTAPNSDMTDPEQLDALLPAGYKRRMAERPTATQ